MNVEKHHLEKRKGPRDRGYGEEQKRIRNKKE